MTVFIIAEAGSSHDNDLQKAYRLIEAAKECGADAVKFQWTSSADHMAKRRYGPAGGISVGPDGHDPLTDMYRKYLEKPVSWLESIKAHADKVGIEFMCSTFLIEDIATIAPLVKRFKVSAYESGWAEFLGAHHSFLKAGTHKEVIVSKNADTPIFRSGPAYPRLLCVSKYPTDISELGLHRLHGTLSIPGYHGLSDHTANVLTGAAAVAAGARIVECHIRSKDTAKDNPDYGHSLIADWYEDFRPGFATYVQNIRTVERML